MLSEERKTKYMQVAFNLAKKYDGLTSSNPSVGCVVVKDDVIVSCATTAVGGRPHAENIALSGNLDLEGAVLFVTLEPCNHYGKTPPCVNSIINAKIRKVFISVKDPDKRVDGTGIEALLKANIEIETGIMEEEISRFYRSYLTAKNTKKPFVTAKIACSMDGKIASFTNDSKWISCEKARYFTNFLRHKYNGILIGGNTYRKDNPNLSCRIDGISQFSPMKIILSNTLSDIEGFTILGGKVEDILSKLYQDFHINHLLIEGGAGTITKFLEEDAVNEIIMIHAPFFIGSDGKNCIQSKGLEFVLNAKRYKILETFQVGECIFSTLSPTKS